MKKVLILFLLALGVAFAIPRVERVKALESAHEVNYAGLWVFDEVDDDVWSAVFELSFTQGTLSTLDIKIPAHPLNIQTKGGYESTFIVMGGAGTIVSSNLDDYVGLQANDTIEFAFDTSSITTDGVLNEDVDIVTTNYVFIRMMLDTATAPPAQALYWIRANASAIGVTVLYMIFYFDRGTLVEISELSAFLASDIPGDPTPPTDYVFAGWRTKTGVRVYESGDVLNFVMSDDYLSIDAEYGTYIPFYSYFIKDATAQESIADPDPETVPTFLSGPLGEIGLDTDAGYMLVYIIVVVLITLGILATPIGSWTFVIIAIFIWTIAAAWLGIIPFWAVAILGLFMIGFILKGLTGNQESKGSDV